MSYTRLGIKEVLEDLASRFLINLPAEEQKSLERICFQVEAAYWFYQDFVREQNFTLPSYPPRTFFQALLRASGIQLDGDPATAYDRFLKYKFTVPVCGAIMLNESLDKVVLVKGYKSGASWSFPRGKINQNESERDCAVREVWEETGYDLSPYFDPSVVPRSSASKMGPAPLREGIELDDAISVSAGESRLKLFIVPGVPESTTFETRTRREIGKIAWFPISSLATHQGHSGRSGGVSGDDALPGNKFYMVASAIKPLRAWIKRYRKEQKGAMADRSASASPSPAPVANHIASQPSYADVEEANRALQALFFGSQHVNEPKAPVANGISRSEAVPGDIKILQKQRAPSAKAGQPAGLLDDAERQRQQAAVLSTLFDITKADSPVEPIKSNEEILDALFANGALGKHSTPERARQDAHKRAPTLEEMAALFESHITSQASSPQGKAVTKRMAEMAGLDLAVLGEELEPQAYAAPSRPLQPHAALPPSVAFPSQQTHAYGHSMPPPVAPNLTTMLMPAPGISAPMQVPFVPPFFHGMPPMHAMPLPPAPMPMHQRPQIYQSPPRPVTVSNAGPPLQPTPRRPITLLEHVTTPPPMMAKAGPSNSDALLSLLNLGPAGASYAPTSARL